MPPTDRQAPAPSALASPPATQLALIDAHVHLHRRFSLPAVFDHAAANVARAATQLQTATTSPGVLMLTEPAGVDRFGELLRHMGGSIGSWAVRPCNENESLRLHRSTDHTLLVIAGRQVVTRERLEVLALGTRRRIDDGQSLEATLTEARRAAALPVLPWGFGKWTGRRGRIIEQLLASADTESLFVGDNGGRPHCSPTPRLLRLAQERGIRVLPGTDPLPFAYQQRRAGRYGFLLPLSPDERRPFQAIHDLLLAQPAQPPIFGRREGYLAFTLAQLGMQWHNRTRRRRR